MIDDFLKQLKIAQKIEPSKEYKEKSLRLILANSQYDITVNSWRMLIVRIGAVGTVLAMTLLVVSKSPIPMKVAGLDIQDLKAEAEVLDVNLNIAEIKESGLLVKQTNIALEESAKSDPGHLNATILKREESEIDLDDYYDDAIDQALEKTAE